MLNDFHWGGINVKSLCKAVLSDLWMVIAVMVIAYFGIGIVGNMRYTPSYTSSTVVAAYPSNKMSTPESSSDSLDTVTALNEVFNSEMFKMGLNDHLAEPADYYLYSQQINNTSILMISVSSASPEKAYQILRTALEYFEEISSHLVGDCHLEILTEPDFPLHVSNESSLLKRRLLLTLFMGFAMGGFLVLMYVMRKTYKSSSAIQRYYKSARFFKVKASASDKHRNKSKKKNDIVPNKEAIRKTALQLLQMLRAKNANSIFITSAASNEGKTDITVSLAREIACSGKSVLILETDPENSEILNRVDLEREAADLPDQSINVIFADKDDEQDDFTDSAIEVESKLELELDKYLGDVILIDGPIWTGSNDEQIWKNAADTSVAVCRQDRADFYAIDRMMTDLQENNPDFLGCVLYGF